MKQICKVKLREQLYDRCLPWSFVRKTVQTFLPHFFHRAVRTQTRHEGISGRPNAKELVIVRMLDHIPALAAKVLAADANGRMQGDPSRGAAVPGLAECL